PCLPMARCSSACWPRSSCWSASSITCRPWRWGRWSSTFSCSENDMENAIAQTPSQAPRRLNLFDGALVWPAMVDAVRILHPRAQVRSPVMFVVYVGSIVTTLLWFQALAGQGEAPAGFILATAAWLWFTVLFAN